MATAPSNPFIIALTEKQKGEMVKLKRILEERGAYTPKQGEKPASADDIMLLRFLRARRWAPQAAADQFCATLAWRKEYDVENMYRKETDPEEYEEWKQLYPKWTGRRDKWGNPVYVYKLAVLTSSALKGLSKIPEPVRYQRIIALYELLTHFAFPVCLSLPCTPPSPSSTASTPIPPPETLPPDHYRVVQNTTIVDFTNTSLSSMFSFRGHLGQASGLAQANHPETLGVIYVFGAPGWWSTVWGWIKNWFDEQTRNKVHILPNPLPTDPSKNELLQLVPAHSLPRIYGGTLDWEYEHDPDFDPDADALLKQCGAPVDARGKASVRGPVDFRPPGKGGEPASLQFVGRGRHEVGVQEVEQSSSSEKVESAVKPEKVANGAPVENGAPITNGQPVTSVPLAPTSAPDAMKALVANGQTVETTVPAVEETLLAHPPVMLEHEPGQALFVKAS